MIPIEGVCKGWRIERIRWWSGDWWQFFYGSGGGAQRKDLEVGR